MKKLGQLVRTIKEKCRVCYTCVRECPAKAIRVTGGQAEVINERCIGCGNCVRVCSQHAKEVQNSIEDVLNILKSNDNVTACIAPSFPAEFTEYDYRSLVGILRKLGFSNVVEVAFGADLVALQYKNAVNKDKKIITTACPAIVSYVEKYFPNLVTHLAAIVSPMTAMSKVIRKKYGEDSKIVFIGPCIAKKHEANKYKKDFPIDEVITFAELREMISNAGIKTEDVKPSDFDPPIPKKGIIFPVGGGLLQAAGLDENLILNNIVSTEGTRNFVEAIKEFESGDLDANLLDILCCDGCIMGPGFTTKMPKYRRHAVISDYARKRINSTSIEDWEKEIEENKNLDLNIIFKNDDKRLNTPSKEIIKKILKRMGKTREEDELNCGACGYETCMMHAIAIHKGLAESEMCLPYAIEKFKENAKELSESYKQLENAQQALIQSEKLASMGQLAAGIAHEINNPLGVVLLYAHLLLDNCNEDSNMHGDLKMIVEQADRCKNIVGGLLNFARKNKVVFKKADINKLLNKCINAVRSPDNIKVKLNNSDDEILADIDVDQIMQVFINLLTNSIEAMPDGGNIIINSLYENDRVLITIKDTGIGIDDDLLKKVFEPFFTTKQMGKGTGLGLAVTYGIIKMHRGNIEVSSNNKPERGETGTVFKVYIPINQVDGL